MSNQTKIESIVEAGTNTLIGFGLAVFSQTIIFPCYGIIIPIETNIKIVFWFTVISVIRTYIVRRWFNKQNMKQWLPSAKRWLSQSKKRKQ